ncbi:MAG: hypothetical protein B5766_00365 [Candidatus Lumbricidophila eiseniae]|uniref:Gram-positive cocci surface proteins LPxTG domain-containing protein n=1 Tax=Candidatus Lumbricidiphila eiseniae TaxID=1969409 RepID=A0A2A6FUJ1_9MICO|nr:MAG: hypothetical protein B5766_00365 [Candidatus Lumbricidophila eiseniae]
MYYTDPTGRTHDVQTGTCGAAGETTTVTPPGVTTTAQPDVILGQPARDTAHVTGPITIDTGYSWQVEFRAFKQEVDTSGNLVSVPACEATNLVFTSTAKQVRSAGDVDSDTVVFTTPGKYFWVATLWMIGPEGTRHLATKGTCGADGETTTVTAQLVIPPVLPPTGTAPAPTLVIGGLLTLLGVLSFLLRRRKSASPLG